jgi:hypothetical protein
MNLGGPVWHASAAPFPITGEIDWDYLKARAYAALEGVGDKSLGEWEEKGSKAFHLRRRLRDEEFKLVGPVVDIRGTPEVMVRLAPVRHIIGYSFNG